MMKLESLITSARDQGASDLHIEGGLPVALRIRGQLRTAGEPVSLQSIQDMVDGVVGADGWDLLRQQRSLDLAQTIAGVRCRINVLHSFRGMGLAIRLLSSSQASLKRQNLHPDIKKLVQPSHGLVLVTGPTGSGKTTTLAALVQEINATEARHIITLECPIEYALRPQLSFIRQREVGRDTPSFEQGLHDALREDPDVLMVGEMREPETMRLTLNAAETGHLVLATMHSSSAPEALQRLVASFPPEMQSATCAILADCLVGVLSQRLRYQSKERIRVPECEMMLATTAVRAIIRSGQFFKLPSAMESGGQEGHWTAARYRDWLDHKTDWFIPTSGPVEGTDEPARESPRTLAPPPPVVQPPPAPVSRFSEPTKRSTPRRTNPPAPQPSAAAEEGVIVIGDDSEDLAKILSEMEKK